MRAKLQAIKEEKKAIRDKKSEFKEANGAIKRDIRMKKNEKSEIEAVVARACIDGRNDYSRDAIREDYAAGIKELDQEIAPEEDEENFDPDTDVRDYDEVARSLPVFCVSARGYQKLQGRLKEDAPVSGFTEVDQTEIPALQAHCKNLTIAGRTAACKKFLTKLSTLLNSMTLWASNDGTGANLTPEQREKEARSLSKSLKNLESVSGPDDPE